MVNLAQVLNDVVEKAGIGVDQIDLVVPHQANIRILEATAKKLGLPPEPLVLAVLFGCNLCYATPIAYQTNMLIMAEGSYEFRDYVRTGVPLVLIMVTILSVALAVTYRL